MYEHKPIIKRSAYRTFPSDRQSVYSIIRYSEIILHQRGDELQQRAHDLVVQLLFFDGSVGDLAAL